LGKIVNYVDSSTPAGAAKPKKMGVPVRATAIYIKTKTFHGGVCPVTGQAGCFLCRRRSPGRIFTKTRYPSMAISRIASSQKQARRIGRYGALAGPINKRLSLGQLTPSRLTILLPNWDKSNAAMLVDRLPNFTRFFEISPSQYPGSGAAFKICDRKDPLSLSLTASFAPFVTAAG
jgi:hypothetical protein